MASVTANCPMVYAFSREGALPLPRAWHKLNPATRTLANAVWPATGGAFVSIPSARSPSYRCW
jgi:amino acid transporter